MSLNWKREKNDFSSASYLGVSLLLFLVFGGQLAYQFYYHTASAGWVQTPAVVSSLINKPKKASLFYRYGYDGREFTGSRYQYFSKGTVPEKREINRRFQKGDSILVYVNPKKSSQSVVKRSSPSMENMGTHLFLLTIALAVFLGNRVQRRKNKRRI